MAIDSILRPDSTPKKEDEIQRLLKKGYFPVHTLPRDTINRIHTVNGPLLPGMVGNPAGLYKVPAGTVDTAAVPVSSFRTGTNQTVWGSVLYVVIWETGTIQARAGTRPYLLAQYIQDAEKYNGNSKRQQALYTQYVVAYADKHPQKAYIRQAIAGALSALEKERTEKEP